MSGKKLDRSRKYGTIVGAHDGSAWWQDGTAFNVDGNEVGTPPEVAATIPDKPGPSEVELGSPEAMRADLQAMHPSTIKKLVLERDLVLETGVGSKKRNIENLLAAS